ncbi:Uncharacterized protein FKW44_000506, partial [Caligus rogercresseyi]
MIFIAEDDFMVKISKIFGFSSSLFYEFPRLKWSSGFNSCINLISHRCRPRSFHKIPYNDVTRYPMIEKRQIWVIIDAL